MKKILFNILILLMVASVSFADEVRYKYDYNFPSGVFNLETFRNTLRGLHQMDLMPLKPSAKRIIDGMEYSTNSSIQSQYSGTGVTITKDDSNEQEGNYSLKAVTDATNNRSFDRDIVLNLSAFEKILLWERSSQSSDAFQFFVEDSSGNQSRWDITSSSTANTWKQETITLNSPDSNSGIDADLSDVVKVGFRNLSASTTYYFDTIKAIVGMTVSVSGTNLGEYYRHVYNGIEPLTVDAQSASAITAPTSNPRIDVLTMDSSGSLSWVTGIESSSPVPSWSDVPSNVIPICLVYQKPTMTKVLDFEDKDTDTNQGYILADVRPFLKNGFQWKKGSDVASSSSVVLGNDGNYFDITGTTNIQTLQAKPAGEVVWLHFDSNLTVLDGTGNLNLNGNFDTSSGYVLQLVSDGSSWYEVSRQPTAGDFISLDDTPGSFSGQAHKFMRVNTSANALEFVDPDFLMLDDTPTSYSGQAGKAVFVKTDETGLEFGDIQGNLSNVVFQYVASTSGAQNNVMGEIHNTEQGGTQSLLSEPQSHRIGYRYFVVDSSSYREILRSKFLKAEGVSNLKIYAELWAPGSSGILLQVTAGTQSVVLTRSPGNSTPTWVSTDLDVSSLTNGTVYDLTFDLKGTLTRVYCGNIMVFAEE